MVDFSNRIRRAMKWSMDPHGWEARPRKQRSGVARLNRLMFLIRALKESMGSSNRCVTSAKAPFPFGKLKSDLGHLGMRKVAKHKWPLSFDFYGFNCRINSHI